jgi:hypothetical protein
MQPVLRALQTIAAIQREDIERMHEEMASTYPTKTVLSQNFSASRQGYSDYRSGPTAPFMKAATTADLDRRLATPQINQDKAAAPEADREIRIDKRDRVVVAPARDIPRYLITSIVCASGLAMVLCLGWIGGVNLGLLTMQPSPSGKNVESLAEPTAAKSDRLAVQGLSANTIATGTHSAHESSKRGRQPTDSTKQATGASKPTAIERTKVPAKPAPVPETRPTTIEGWIIREVNGGTAVLEGPNGVWEATRGDTVPGVGKIDSIVRWGNRWIVATTRGLISTP